MRQDFEKRCVRLGRYIAQTGATIRQTAKAFSLSKSLVHKDVHERLRLVQPGLYEEARRVLAYNQSVRHLRGGAATKRRWALLRSLRDARR